MPKYGLFLSIKSYPADSFSAITLSKFPFTTLIWEFLDEFCFFLAAFYYDADNSLDDFDELLEL